MPRPSTGTLQWDPSRKVWLGRISLCDGSRPWVPCPAEFPRNARGEQRAREWIAERAAIAKAEKMTREDFAIATRKPAAAAPVEGETVEAWFKRFYDWRADRGYATTKQARGRVKKWILPLLGAKRMVDVTRADAESVVAHLDHAVATNVIAWKSALNLWAECTKAFDEATHWKRPPTWTAPTLRVLTSNPFAGVRGPDRGAQRSKPFLRPEEIVALLSCEAVPLYRRRVYAVACYTGARSSELRALRPSDVSFETSQISIAKQRSGGATRTSTKGGRARMIAIEPTLVPLLRILVAAPEGRDGLLLRVPHESECSSCLRDDLRAAGCTREELWADDELRAPIVFHNLRHTCGVHMAVRRDAPFDVQWRLGHSTPAMTERYIQEARFNAGPSFGTPFPALPASLLGEQTDDDDPERGGSESSSAIVRGGTSTPDSSAKGGVPKGIRTVAETPRSPGNPGRSSHVDATRIPGDMGSNPADRGDADERETNPDDSDDDLRDVVVEDAEPVTRVEAEHAHGFAVAFTRDGSSLDVDRLGAMLAAVDSLIEAGLFVVARTTLREARTVVEAAQGPRAPVVELRIERSKRRES